MAKYPLRACLIACVAALWVGSAIGADRIRPLSTQCIQRASAQYGIHTDILFAILMVEGGTVGRDSRANSNGTYDIGLFQINSMHRKELASIGIDERELRNDGCVNAMVAARHLKKVITPKMLSNVRTQDDYLRMIANYHSATPKYNKIYADKLLNAFTKLYASDQK